MVNAGHIDAGPAVSPSDKDGLIAAAQHPARLFQKMASDPGRESPDTLLGSHCGEATSVHDAHSSRAPLQYSDHHHSEQPLCSSPFVELLGTELYDKELELTQ